MPGGAASCARRARPVQKYAPKGEQLDKTVSRSGIWGGAGGACVSFCFPSRCCHENSSLSLWGNLFSTQFQGQKLFSLPEYLLLWSFVNEITQQTFHFAWKMWRPLSFLAFFPSTKCELFTRVTLSGLLVCVISRAIGYLQKSSAYGMCQTDLSLSRKQPQAPLLTTLSICADLVGFATAELLLSCFAASPHLRLAPCQGSCPLGLAAAAGDPRRIQTTPHFVTLYSYKSGESKLLHTSARSITQNTVIS